jgi:hypothetical protein
MSKTKVKIDWKQVENLLMAGCSGVEIAASLGIHENTLYKRCKDDLKVEFVAFSQQNKAKGDCLLKAKQFESAIKDKNTPMQIWLGKQRLGQKEKTDLEINSVSKLHIEVPKKPDNENNV